MRSFFITILALAAGCDANFTANTQQILVDEGESSLNDATFRLLLAEPVSSKSSVRIAWETISRGDSTTVYSLRIGTDPSCRTTVFSFNDLLEASLAVDFIRDGVYYVCAEAKTSGGLVISAENNGAQIVIDQAAPVITASQTVFTTDQPVVIAPEVSDQTALTYQWQKVSGGGDALLSEEASKDVTVSFTASGSYALRLTAWDAVQHKSERDFMITASFLVRPGRLPFPCRKQASNVLPCLSTRSRADFRLTGSQAIWSSAPFTRLLHGGAVRRSRESGARQVASTLMRAKPMVS